MFLRTSPLSLPTSVQRDCYWVLVFQPLLTVTFKLPLFSRATVPFQQPISPRPHATKQKHVATSKSTPKMRRHGKQPYPLAVDGMVQIVGMCDRKCKQSKPSLLSDYPSARCPSTACHLSKWIFGVCAGSCSLIARRGLTHSPGRYF